jgi:hypothetical protein
MNRIKYIRTQDDEIIIFGKTMNHSDFKRWNPKSAGFVSMGIDQNGNPSLSCYGESVSLNLKSNSEEDTKLAKLQLGMLDF